MSVSKHKITIECRQLTRVFKGFCRSRELVAINDISFTIKQGEIIGLVGPNGAGKTTLLSLIAGIILPTRGGVTICGYKARSIAARNNIGYMPEFPSFLGLYSARKILRYHGGLLGWTRKKARDSADRLLEELDLSDAGDRPSYSFSQGMKQRLAFGIAYMGSPKVLILDEPSNGLDPIGIIKLRTLIKKISNFGTTILISSHRLDELEKLTSNYIFLQHGKIVNVSSESLSNQKKILKIEFLPNDTSNNKKLLSDFEVLKTTNTKVILNVNSIYDVPEIVSHFIKNGLQVISVNIEHENIENIFTKLYNERK